MSLLNRYFNYKNNDYIYKNLNLTIPAEKDLSKYNEHFLNFTIENCELIKTYIKIKLNNYVQKYYLSISVTNADINYFIEKINLFVNKKFTTVINELNIEHLLSFIDYMNDSRKKKIEYNNLKSEYFKMMYENLFDKSYNINGHNGIGNGAKKLVRLIDELWTKINFTNIVNFTNILSKLKYFGQNIDEYISLISNKFDSINNIHKLLNFMSKNLLYSNDNDNTNNDNDNDNDNGDDNYKTNSANNKIYNFRFIIFNLKSYGFLLYEEFNKLIKTKYKKKHDINDIKTDKKIINYLIYQISQKDTNQTNRKINEMLIKIKNYLDDVENNYHNNIAYKMIKIKQESEKYKSIDLGSYNRDNATFNIYKYSNMPNLNMHSVYDNDHPTINDFKLTKEIEPYFDIYKSYYHSRYPDRKIEFDLYQSTMIVKMKFNERNYYVQLALVQYLVLDQIFKSKTGIDLGDISEKLNIPIKYLQETINSLLSVKLIKRTTESDLLKNIKLFINYEFEYKTNKVSIDSLLENEEKNKVEIKKEFMHDRNTIILSNMYDYVKKNKKFTIGQIYDILSKNKIPFEIDLEQIENGIKTMLEKEYISFEKKDDLNNAVFNYVE